MSIRQALLALVQTEPKFGLQLKSEFETYTGEIWPLNVGQVYSTLSRLERDGHVEVAGDVDAEAGQKLYTITDDGKAALDAWLHATDSPTKPPRNELVIKVLIALTMEHIDVELLIQTHRRPLLESMQSITKLKVDEVDLSPLLAIDAELFRLEAAVRWLDLVDARLRHGGHLVVPATPEEGTTTTTPHLQAGRTSS